MAEYTDGMMDEDADSDVLVVGAGLVGLSCAVYLQKAGRRVHLVDAGRVAGGASSGNCGLLTPSMAAPLHGPGMVWEAVGLMLKANAPLTVRPRLDQDFLLWAWRFARSSNLEGFRASLTARKKLMDSALSHFDALVDDDKVACGFQRSGLLVVAMTPSGLEKINVAAQTVKEFDVKSKAVGPTEAVRLESALREPLGGVLYPSDAQVEPGALADVLRRQFKQAGGRLTEKCAILSANKSGATIDAVETNRGPIRPRSLVLATGALTSRMAELLGTRIPIEAGKGHSVTFPKRDLKGVPKKPLLLYEKRLAVTPWRDEVRIGGMMEFRGLDDRINSQRIDQIAKDSAQYLQTNFKEVRGRPWCGWRPMSPDDTPLIGAIPGLRNAYVATGHGMLGVSMSLATGKLLTEVVTGTAPHIDPTPYDPARFIKSNVKKEILSWA